MPTRPKKQPQTGKTRVIDLEEEKERETGVEVYSKG